VDSEINHGLKWSAVSVIVVRVLSAARSLVVARLVGPKSVGSFAAAFAFVALASLVAEFGLPSFLIQRGKNAVDDAFAVGQLALFTGSASALALLLFSNRIADFYGNPEVAGLVAALTASVFLTGLIVVPSALLRAAFRFDAVGRAAVVAEATACAVGIGAAIAGAGVWALVASALTSQAVTLVMLLLARPAWTRSPKTERATARRNALRFGVSLATGSAVWTFALQGDNVIVGRVMGATALGLYAFAYNYGVLPGGLVGSTVSDVALAGLSNERNDQQRVALFAQFIRIGNAAASPLVLLAIALVPASVRLVLGPEWLGAIHPLQVLLVVGWVRGVLPTEALLRAKGLVSVEMKVGLVAAPATIAAAYFGAKGNLTTVALSVGLILVMGSFVATAIAVRSIGSNLGLVIRSAVPSAALSALCVSPLFLNEAIRVVPDAAALFVGGPLGVIVCAVCVRRWLPQDWSSLRSIVMAKQGPSPG
jgi:PST family polysaccharide transporter